MQTSRAAALAALAALLETLEGGRAAARRFAAIWPPLLALLWDAASDVRAAVAPVVGRLGAIAARNSDGSLTGALFGMMSGGAASRHRGVCLNAFQHDTSACKLYARRCHVLASSNSSVSTKSPFPWGCSLALEADSGSVAAVTTPGVLFDWALPVLTPRDGKARAKDVGVRFAALSALRECLAVADDVTLARYATAVCNAVQKLLEDEQTQMQLLTPLLGVVAQVRARSRSRPSGRSASVVMRSRFGNACL